MNKINSLQKKPERCNSVINQEDALQKKGIRLSRSDKIEVVNEDTDIDFYDFP